MIITFVMPDYPKEPTGGYRIVFQYANELVKKGYKLNIIFPSILKKVPIDRGIFNHIKWFIKSILFRIFLPKKPVIDWQSIDSSINQIYVYDLNEKYIPNGDIIIATAWQTAEWVNSYSAIKGKKFYFLQHYEIWAGPKGRVDRTWTFPMKKIVIASWLRNLGESFGLKKISIVPNPIDHNNFYITKNIKERNRMKVSMLYHQSEWKGSQDGLQAIEIVKRKIPGIQAVLFGFPKRGDEIPEWIDYVQKPSQEYLRDTVYNESSIFICPSWKEGWGLPVSEAMACGCAIISTNNGGVNDFAIHNETALISPIKNPNELAKNIIKLITNDNLREKLSFSGRKKICEFTIERSISLFEKALLSELN